MLWIYLVTWQLKYTSNFPGFKSCRLRATGRQSRHNEYLCRRPVQKKPKNEKNQQKHHTQNRLRIGTLFSFADISLQHMIPFRHLGLITKKERERGANPNPPTLHQNSTHNHASFELLILRIQSASCSRKLMDIKSLMSLNLVQVAKIPCFFYNWLTYKY